MAVLVEYDKETSLGFIFTTTNGGTVFSTNKKSSTAFDYFDNNCVVNDAIYFGTSWGGYFHSLKIYVGTAFAATSVTFVWEYWNGSAWTAFTPTDGTAGFTNLGENWVTWSPIVDWQEKNVNSVGSSYAFVRCRISAINTPTEGGAQSTQTIKGKDNILYVSGGTSGTPATFTDIYNADVAAGWGVFRVLGRDSIIFESFARINFSDYFTDIDKIIIFSDGIVATDWGWVMYGASNSVVNFGTLLNEARKTTVAGCIFYFKENTRAYYFMDKATTSTVNFYSCVFKSHSFNRCNLRGATRVWNCFGDRAGFRDVVSGVTDIANVITTSCSESIANSPLSVDSYFAIETPIAGPPPNSEMFLKNCKCRTSGNEVTTWAATAGLRTRLVNADINWSEFSASWGGSPTGGEVWRDYDLFLKVIDKNNTAISTATDTPGSFGRNWYDITGVTALEYKTNVAPGTTSTATRTAGQPWTISFRTDSTVWDGVNGKYAFDTLTGRIVIGIASGGENGWNNGTTWRNVGFFVPGVQNYSLVCDGTNIRAYRNGRPITTTVYADAKALDGAGKWGQRYAAPATSWDFNLEYACVHASALTLDQIKTLHEQFNGKKTILLEDKDGDIQLNCFLNPDGYMNSDFGTATSGTTTTLTDTSKTWDLGSAGAVPIWVGHDLLITSGTGVGQRTTISSNTGTVLTFATLATAPDNTSKYVIIPIITHSKWNYLNGTTPSDTYNDYTLKINKSGYVFRPMKLTIDRKIDDVISLERVLDNNFSKNVTINTK